MINFLHSNRKAKNGFTLIESIIAITILTIVIAVPMTIISSSLISNQETKNSVAAQTLAQSILEDFRAQRDTNFIQRLNWDSGFEEVQVAEEKDCQEDQFAQFTCEIVFNRGTYSGRIIDYITISVKISWESQQRGAVDTTVELSQTLYRWLDYSAKAGTI